MTAFLKIDDCRACHRAFPWEWFPALLLGGKPLAGTGIWRSTLTNGLCSACTALLETQRQQVQREATLRHRLLQLLGGEKPFREFTFDRYEVTPGNRLAYERARQFSPASDNLYLWGPCGVGKTHLAWAAARSAFEQTLSITIVAAAQLSRRVRMKDPNEEQSAISEFSCAEMIVVDDLGGGRDTPFSRQILQEIIDARDFSDRAGLLVTSKYSLDDLAIHLDDDSIPSRLSGLCQVVEVTGLDHRLQKSQTPLREPSP